VSDVEQSECRVNDGDVVVVEDRLQFAESCVAERGDFDFNFSGD